MIAAAAILVGSCEPPFGYRENIGTVHGYYIRNNSSAPLMTLHRGEEHFLFSGEWDYWRVDTTLWRDTALLVFGADDTVRHLVDRAEGAFLPSPHNILDLSAFEILDTVDFRESLSPDYLVYGKEVRHVFLVADADRP